MTLEFRLLTIESTKLRNLELHYNLVEYKTTNSTRNHPTLTLDVRYLSTTHTYASTHIVHQSQYFAVRSHVSTGVEPWRSRSRACGAVGPWRSRSRPCGPVETWRSRSMCGAVWGPGEAEADRVGLWRPGEAEADCVVLCGLRKSRSRLGVAVSALKKPKHIVWCCAGPGEAEADWVLPCRPWRSRGRLCGVRTGEAEADCVVLGVSSMPALLENACSHPECLYAFR